MISHDDINTQVQEFLRGSGGNVKLADTLRDHGEFALGPVEYPLDEIIDIIGPTSVYKYYEEETALNARVDAMVKNMKAGWQPEPLLVTNIWNDDLEIADGGHRHRALLRLGHKTYPTIIYFRDKQSRQAFVQEHPAILNT